MAVNAERMQGGNVDDPVRYAVALHVLMSEAEIELWES